MPIPPPSGVSEVHPTVGRVFRSFGATYRCTSWDRSCGFWMEQLSSVGSNSWFPGEGPGDRRNVSERAIGRTYQRDRNDGSSMEHETPCNCHICEERPRR